MFEEASFKVLSSERISAPFGNCCDCFKTRNGAALSKYKTFTISNYVRPLNTITLAAMRDRGFMELVDGTCIRTEGERLALMDEVTRSVTEGGVMTVTDWVAVRPLELCEGIRHGVQKPNGHAM